MKQHLYVFRPRQWIVIVSVMMDCYRVRDVGGFIFRRGKTFSPRLRGSTPPAGLTFPVSFLS